MQRSQMNDVSDTPNGGEADGRRRDWMALLAQATEAELTRAVDALRPLPPCRLTRAPEVGLVMLQGRIGGDGARFNLGEATVTRCVVTLEDGASGVAYLLGRAPKRARYAALLDALAQRPNGRETLEDLVFGPVRDRLAAQADRVRRQTAATKVDFFTVAAGNP